MDLMTLAAKIVLDDSSYKKGIENAEGMGRNLAGKMSAMTVAVGNLAADMIKKAVSAVGSVINGAIDGYADYQQLIGGVETLFKGSADTVAKYAKQSFKTTGLSANDYMETVTSFSASLLQGLGGRTEEAAEMANMAVTDMADNANKMGTDISAIQSAYQGFAKQNYTMLDNLKLGYGGTAGEMVRLINESGILEEEISDLDNITFDQIVQAIHKVQEEMGITGTTAKEAAETISGSKASLAAAWQDMLSAVGGEGDQSRLDETLENFKTSFSTYMENFIPTLVTTIVNSGSLVNGIADAIGSLPSDLLSTIADAGLEAGTDMVGGVSKITGWLIDNITNMFRSAKNDPSKVQEFGTAIGEFLGDTISQIVTNAPTILEGIVSVGVNLAGGLIQGLFQGLFGSDSELEQINQDFTKSVAETEKQATKASAILSYMDELQTKYGAAATQTAEWQKAEDDLEKVLGGSKDVFESYGTNVQGAIDKLRGMADELRKLAIQQAIQDKMSAQYELLGEKTLELSESRARQGEAQAIIDMQPQRNIENVKAYAQALQEIGQNMDIDPGTVKMWGDLAAGFVTGPEGETLSLADMSKEMLQGWIDELGQTLEGYYEAGGYLDKQGNYHEFGENDQVWNKDYFDNILSPEALQALQADVNAAQDTIKAEVENQANIQKEISEINNQIKTTEQAMKNALDDVYTVEEDGASKIGQSGQNVADSLNGAAEKIDAIDFSGGGGNAPELAIGINDVPWDGYRAKLHKGEAVLSKAEADQWRQGTNSENVAEMIGEAVESALSHLYLNMDGNRVADMTTRRTGRNISANEVSRVRAMGG